mgnify:CR=1 FL=1
MCLLCLRVKLKKEMKKLYLKQTKMKLLTLQKLAKKKKKQRTALIRKSI